MLCTGTQTLYLQLCRGRSEERGKCNTNHIWLFSLALSDVADEVIDGVDEPSPDIMTDP